MSAKPPQREALSASVLDALIRAGLIALLVAFCFRIFHPFLNLLLWSVILAVMLYPLHRRLARRLGQKGDGRAGTLIVLLGIAVLAVPVYLLGMSLTDSAHRAMELVKADGLHVPPPPDAVATWPLVGERLHAFWLQAATDLTGLARNFAPQVKEVSLTLLSKMAKVGIGLLMFLAALVIAGIVMAYGAAGHNSAIRICARIFSPEKALHITELCTATIRAVAQGVVGIAFAQMLLIGIGFVAMDIPGAGLLALVVLVFGILQLPATLVTLPVIIYVFATRDISAGTVVFAIYVFVAGLIDNVLKPLLLGRGVDVPMPVILVGALGGMITDGIIGLFVGPVVLAVAYELFWQWVDDRPAHLPSEPASPAPDP
jgi:predicted PurR-regulated permease PerM